MKKIKTTAKTTRKVFVKKIKPNRLKGKKTRRLLKKTVKKIRRRKLPAKKMFLIGKKRAVGENNALLAKSSFKAKIKVIGVGGGGGSIVSEIGRSLEKATFVIADTDARAFKKRRGIKYFVFGKELTHGLGTGLNPQAGKIAAQQARKRIAGIFKEQDIVIFIASLGGGVGSGATPVFVQEAAQNFGGISFGIFTLPFRFEGMSKYRIALKALSQLRKSLSVSLTIPNERIFKIIDANTPITTAFSLVNKSLIESLESLIDLIYNPGVINIDFADLRTILKGTGNLAFLNTVEASGKDRVRKITQGIFNNPLYRSNNLKAQKILFNIQGGRDLSMFEVDAVSRAIAEQNPKAKIIFGISKNSTYRNKIKTSLLMTGSSISQSKAAVGKTKKQPAVKRIKKNNKETKKKDHNILVGGTDRERIEFKEGFPVVSGIPAVVDIALEPNLIQRSVVEEKVNKEMPSQKKTIRRTALDIKKDKEKEENEKLRQEKEWEIPAFLRKIKFRQ